MINKDACSSYVFLLQSPQPMPTQNFPSIADENMASPAVSTSTSTTTTTTTTTSTSTTKTSVDTSGDLSGIRKGLAVFILAMLVSIVGLVSGFCIDGG